MALSQKQQQIIRELFMECNVMIFNALDLDSDESEYVDVRHEDFDDIRKLLEQAEEEQLLDFLD